jgi:hypothetical protein
MAGSKRHKILFRKIGITPGNIRYVLFPAWLLSVSYRGKTYLSVMNASNGKTTISVPRSRFKDIVITLGFGGYGAGLFALASIPVTMPVPPALYSWIIIPIYVFYLPSLVLVIFILITSHLFCCKRLFKGMFSVLLISLALLLAGLLMIYAFYAVYDGSKVIEWTVAICFAFYLTTMPFWISKR